MTTRASMQPVARRWRAFFAPVDRDAGTPQLFDPAAGFALDAPPAPWLDLGWIEGFTRQATTEYVALRGGAKQAVARQARARLGATLAFDFCDWGKLQMALAGGSQHMNVLAPLGSGSPVPSGGDAAPAVAVLPGSDAEWLDLGANAAGFAAGDLIVADLEYSGETGYVGSGIAGAYVRSAADVANDPDYIRRVSFNLARVAEIDEGWLRLEPLLLAGAPASGTKVQKVVAFSDREGGSFFQEWSAVFACETEAGGRVLLHYPRLQPAAPAAEGTLELAAPLAALTLRARFLALPVTDTNDSESCLCWRTYYPVGSSPVF